MGARLDVNHRARADSIDDCEMLGRQCRRCQCDDSETCYEIGFHGRFSLSFVENPSLLLASHSPFRDQCSTLSLSVLPGRTAPRTAIDIWSRIELIQEQLRPSYVALWLEFSHVAHPRTLASLAVCRTHLATAHLCAAALAHFHHAGSHHHQDMTKAGEEPLMWVSHDVKGDHSALTSLTG